MGNVQHLIDFVFYREAMAVPPRTAGDVMTSLTGISGYDIFDGACEDVAVVWQAGGEGRSIVEGVLLFSYISGKGMQ